MIIEDNISLFICFIGDKQIQIKKNRDKNYYVIFFSSFCVPIFSEL